MRHGVRCRRIVGARKRLTHSLAMQFRGLQTAFRRPPNGSLTVRAGVSPTSHDVAYRTVG
jgi:hypothetical protein